MIASRSLREQNRFLHGLSEAEFANLDYDWAFWARKNQLAPAGNWQVWLLLAGRGWGKTRCGAEWVRSLMCGTTPLARGRCRILALVGETAADVRDVMVGDGKGPDEASGILQVHPKDFRPTYHSSLRRLTWPNGAVATLYNATEPEQLRGPQHEAAWCDELAKWRYAQETWDQLQFGLRIGTHPQVCITTTPKPIKLLKEIISDPETVKAGGSTYENEGNLAPIFVKTVVRKYEGTRLGQQELEAKILDDVPGALWTLAKLDELRRRPDQVPALKRVAVAIDPPASSGEDADEAGIVCCGLGIDGHGYVLDDASANMKPAEWANAALKLHDAREGDVIVGEVNNGGEMVENTVRVIRPTVPFKAVRATRGKALRAEPVSMLYEQGLVHHVGAFPMLESQMTSFTADFDRKTAGYSPDRLDALVYCLTELMLEGSTSVHTADESDVVVRDWQPPRHYRRVAALHLTKDRVFAVWGAYESSTDTAWLYGEYSVRRSDLAIHAAAIKDRGDWIPVVFAPEASERKKDQGQKIIERLLSLNMDLFEAEVDDEAAIEEVSARLSGKRIRVSSTMADWIHEYRNFRRDRDGEVMDEAEFGMMKATGLLCLSGLQIAITDRVLDEETEGQYAQQSRNKTTGY